MCLSICLADEPLAQWVNSLIPSLVDCMASSEERSWANDRSLGCFDRSMLFNSSRIKRMSAFTFSNTSWNQLNGKIQLHSFSWSLIESPWISVTYTQFLAISAHLTFSYVKFCLNLITFDLLFLVSVRWISLSSWLTSPSTCCSLVRQSASSLSFSDTWAFSVERVL